MPEILGEEFAPFHVRLDRSPRGVRPPRPRVRPRDRLLNRDLAWLNFNDRVLAEAADPTVPPLERLRFVTIVSSNLDEFFMVRVAGLARLARRDPGFRLPGGLPVGELITQIREHVLRQKARQAVVLGDIIAALGERGIRILVDFGGRRDARLDAQIQARLPPMSICMRRSTQSPPRLASERIHVFVRFPGEYAIVTLEARESRLLELPPEGRTRRYALIERWLAASAARVFPDREVIEAFPFKLIRDADLRYRPDDEDTLEEQIVEAVHRRRRAKVVRLEVDAPSYSEGALLLATSFGLESGGLYRFALPLDLRTLARLHGLRSARRLRYVPIRPVVPAALRRAPSVFAAVRGRDVLLHHPYDSFAAVERFLAEAAADPQVTRIYHAMYRTTRDSPVMNALTQAARRGKQVTACIEIKARFDELNNVRWAEQLRAAGVEVVRPLGTHKAHGKATLVVRLEEEGEATYVHLATGNYHPVTARQYTDLGLLTCDRELAHDVATYFAALSGQIRHPVFRELLVAPGNLHQQTLRLIREETRIQRSGGQGRIAAKMNALVDPDIAEALYEASCAGVRVDLIVRGSCCLIPGIQGMSENIRVVSVIDRFLEHSRAYYFRAGGAERVYLSSADWMPRNFYSRYEIAFPVKDVALKRYVRDVVLAAGLADNVKSWTLLPDGTYARSQRSPGAPALRSQSLFEDLARRRYLHTTLAGR
ncbi:MAG: polyphosphate kinase 1 [Myxococcota bacterium]